MSAVAREPIGALLWKLWRDPAAWVTTSDIFIILIVLSLPWSTSLVAIFAVAALHSMRHMALFSVACIPLLSGWRLAPLPWRIPQPLRYAALVILVLLCGWRWRASMTGNERH